MNEIEYVLYLLTVIKRTESAIRMGMAFVEYFEAVQVMLAKWTNACKHIIADLPNSKCK